MVADFNAYIDESGDRGWKRQVPNTPMGSRSGSSRLFAMTAILVPAGSENSVLTTWRNLAPQLDRKAGDEISWKKIRSHSHRRLIADTLAAVPNLHTISVVLCKHHMINASAIHDPSYLYNWTFRLMIERLSWFGQQQGATVRATFAQVSGLMTARLTLYLQRLKGSDTFIEWDHLKSPFQIDTPKNRAMLQVADSASGAVFAAFEPDVYGYTEQTYLTSLKPVIWRRPGRPFWKDGLKYGPWPSEDCKAEHPWFEGFCA